MNYKITKKACSKSMVGCLTALLFTTGFVSTAAA
jgi:hypothetical protein